MLHRRRGTKRIGPPGPWGVWVNQPGGANGASPPPPDSASGGDPEGGSGSGYFLQPSAPRKLDLQKKPCKTGDWKGLKEGQEGGGLAVILDIAGESGGR